MEAEEEGEVQRCHGARLKGLPVLCLLSLPVKVKDDQKVTSELCSVTSGWRRSFRWRKEAQDGGAAAPPWDDRWPLLFTSLLISPEENDPP